MIGQLWGYLMANKMWWLTPFIILFVIFGALLAVSAVLPISPFIYVLF